MTLMGLPNAVFLALQLLLHCSLGLPSFKHPTHSRHNEDLWICTNNPTSGRAFRRCMRAVHNTSWSLTRAQYQNFLMERRCRI